jgi:hypothetical protein
MQIGGTNLIPNGHAYNNSDYWMTANGASPAGSISIVVDPIYGNAFAYSNSNTGENYLQTLEIKVKPSTKYTFAITSKVSDYVTTEDIFIIGRRATSGSYAYDFVRNAFISLSNTTWQRRVISFETNGDEESLFIRIDNNGSSTQGTAGYVYVTEVSMYEGDKDLGWSTNVNDSVFTTVYQSGITALQNSIALKVSQTDFNALGTRVSSTESAINLLPSTIDARITTQVSSGGSIYTAVAASLTLDGNGISLFGKTINISGATIFSSLATNDSVASAVTHKSGNLVPVSQYDTNTDLEPYSAVSDGVSLSSNCKLYGIYSITQNVTNSTDWASANKYCGFDVKYNSEPSYCYQLDGTSFRMRLKPGTRYIWSAFAYIDGPGNSAVAEVTVEGTFVSRGGNGSTTTTGTWVRLYYIFDTTTNTSDMARLLLYSHANSDSNVVVYWSGMMLEEVSTLITSPSPYSKSTIRQDYISQQQVTASKESLAAGIGYSSYSALQAAAAASATIIDNGKIRTTLIEAVAVVTNGLSAQTINANNATLQNLNVNTGTFTSIAINTATISGLLTCTNAAFNNGTFNSITINTATINNATINTATLTNVQVNGSIRSPFLWTNQSQSAYTLRDNIALNNQQNMSITSSADKVGKRVTISMVKDSSGNYISGTSTITTSDGIPIYENGIAKTSIKVSREIVELLGYGTDTTLMGWIVLNRRDVYTTHKYGYYEQVMYEGYVNADGSLAGYKSFDGQAITSSKSGDGYYLVNIPSTPINEYLVFLGNCSDVSGAGRYASVYNRQNTFFEVYTGDDSTSNSGPFYFRVISTADWN